MCKQLKQRIKQKQNVRAMKICIFHVGHFPAASELSKDCLKQSANVNCDKFRCETNSAERNTKNIFFFSSPFELIDVIFCFADDLLLLMFNVLIFWVTDSLIFGLNDNIPTFRRAEVKLKLTIREICLKCDYSWLGIIFKWEGPFSSVSRGRKKFIFAIISLVCMNFAALHRPKRHLFVDFSWLAYIISHLFGFIWLHCRWCNTLFTPNMASYSANNYNNNWLIQKQTEKKNLFSMISSLQCLINRMWSSKHFSTLNRYIHLGISELFLFALERREPLKLQLRLLHLSR